MWNWLYVSQRVQTDHMAESEWLSDGRGCKQCRWHLYPRVQKQPHLGKVGIWFNTSIDPGSVSSLCSCLCWWLSLSPAVFLSHLHRCDNNRCTALKEIKLGNPQLQIKKKTTQHTWARLWYFTAKARNKNQNKSTARVTSISKKEGSLIGQSEPGCLQTYVSSVLHERIKMAILILIKHYALGLF